VGGADGSGMADGANEVGTTGGADRILVPVERRRVVGGEDLGGHPPSLVVLPHAPSGARRSRPLWQALARVAGNNGAPVEPYYTPASKWARTVAACWLLPPCSQSALSLSRRQSSDSGGVPAPPPRTIALLPPPADGGRGRATGAHGGRVLVFLKSLLRAPC
jgi:hypothetical protein